VDKVSLWVRPVETQAARPGIDAFLPREDRQHGRGGRLAEPGQQVVPRAVEQAPVVIVVVAACRVVLKLQRANAAGSLPEAPGRPALGQRRDAILRRVSLDRGPVEVIDGFAVIRPGGPESAVERAQLGAHGWRPRVDEGLGGVEQHLFRRVVASHLDGHFAVMLAERERAEARHVAPAGDPGTG